jgi:hypothetical protein
MSDLRSLLHEAAGPTPYPTSAWTADADLARAQRALRRRRTGRMIVGSGLVAAVAMTVFAIVTPSLMGDKSSSSIPVASGTLVSYTGTQPRGYILDKVPAGWQVVESDRGILTLAPVVNEPVATGKPLQPPTSEPVPTGGALQPEPSNVDGGIGIWLEARLPEGALLTQVRVGNKRAVIAQMRGGEDPAGGANTLFLMQPSGNYLVIQVSGGLDWDNEDIVELASAVHVTKYATVGAG